MGEQSYFHRKFFSKNEHHNRSKKLKKQNLSPSDSQLSNDSTPPGTETHPKEILSDLPSKCVEGRPGKSVDKVDPGLLIRLPNSGTEKLQDSGQINGIADCEVHRKTQSPNTSDLNVSQCGYKQKHSRIEGIQTLNIDTSQQHEFPTKAYQAARSAENGDHIETIAYHPELPSPPNNSNSERIKDSKLRKATKAILSLRRATSSLTSHHGDNSSVGPSRSFRGFSYPKSLVASFWRQNTADNSTCTRSARLDSLNSHSNWVRSSNSSACQNGGSQFDLSQKTHHRSEMDQESTSSTFRLPQFIVPRMNALKLPIVCLIKSLDGELMREIFIHRYEVGQYLIDNLKVSLGIKDAKYFGLKLAKSIDEQEDVRQPWLELNQSIYKQISKHSKCISLNSNETNQQSAASTTKSVDIYLRIKFYPPNLARIQDQFLKKYLWLQLRRDLRLGKLTSSMNNLTFLMACALQFELDDFKPEYISEKLFEMNVLPNQDMIEQQAIEIWKTRLTGSKRHQIQMQFLRASVILETYGFDYYPVRDHQRQRAYLLGFNYAGIKTIRNGRIVHHFRWHSIGKIAHERRMIIFHIYPTENSKRKQILGFKCLSNEDCLNLYTRLQEQKYFFTVDLTYFDKSLRRPSHLAESALDQKDQQQLLEWAGTSGLPNDLDTYEDDIDDLSDAQGALNQEQTRSQDGDCLGQVQSSRRSPQSTEQPVNQHESPLPGASGRLAFDGCDCASCRRDLQMHQQHQHSNNQSMDSSLSGYPVSFSSATATPITHNSQLLKSRSLQESTTCSSYNNSSGPTNFANQSSSPSTLIEGSECCVSGSCGSSQISSSTMTNHHLDPGTPLLQRQSSVLKYSPDFEMINEAAREQDELSVAVEVQDSYNVGGCVASWTEQVLTQPARIFNFDSWPTQHQETQRRIRQYSLTNQFPNNSLFMQGLFFCLLILAINLALRLSDGISSTLEGFLAFRLAGHGATVHPSASCSSINDMGSLR